MSRNLWNEPEWYEKSAAKQPQMTQQPPVKQASPSTQQPTVIVVPTPAPAVSAPPPTPSQSPVVIHQMPPVSGSTTQNSNQGPLLDGVSWGLLIVILIMFGLLIAVHVRTSCTHSTIVSLHEQTQATLRDLQAELRSQRMRSWVEHQFKRE